MRKYIFITLGLFFIVAAGAIVVGQRNFKKNIPQQRSLLITTSFYPLYFFASEIAKTNATIVNITPPGSEPHDYEPTTQDIVAIQNSSLLVINGDGLETWEGNIRDLLKNTSTTILTASDTITTQIIDSDGKQIRDPHVWLNPILAKKQVENISRAIINLDPGDKNFYEQNTAQLDAKLDELNTAYINALSHCKKNSVITSHEAFSYVAKQYNFNQIAISGISPDEEPSAKKLAAVSDIVKQNNIHFIFFETLLSPRLAESIARETGASTLIFNPLEGLTPTEQTQGKNYFSVQYENIKNLQTALECN